MMHERVAYFLFRDTDFKHFAQKLSNRSSDSIYCLIDQIMENDGFNYGLTTLITDIKSGKIDTLVFFDFYPLVVSEVLKICREYNVRTLYIQHGYIDLGTTSSLASKVNNLSNNVKLYLSLLRNFGWSFSRLNRIVINFVYGGYKGFAMSGGNVHFDECIFWDEISLEKFDGFTRTSSAHNHVIGGVDAFVDNVEYSSNGCVLYVTQPLSETKHMSEKRFFKLIDSVFEEDGNTNEFIVLLHPKLKKFEHILSGKFEVRYSSNIKQIKVSRIVGHFSSLLQYDYGMVPVKISDYGFKEIEVQVKEALSDRNNSLIQSNTDFFHTSQRIIYNDK